MAPRYRWYLAILAAGALVLGVALFRFNPAETAVFPPCPTRALAGVYCPGCGAARASHQLLHGRVGEAFRFNPLLVLMLPVTAWLALGSFRRPRPWWTSRAVLAATLAFTVLRNVPAWPFSLLAPPESTRATMPDKLPR